MTTEAVLGLSDLVRKLDRFPRELAAKALPRAISAGASRIARMARRHVSKKSGALRKSIRIRKVRTAAGSVLYIVHAGKGLRYAPLIEFGTKRHRIAGRKGGALRIGSGHYRSVLHPGARARPFMRPAFDEGYQEALQAMAKKLEKEIEKIARSM